MIIKTVETYLLKKELTSSMRISRGGFKDRQHIIVKVITDDGTFGLGEAVGNASLLKDIIDNISRKIIGVDPFNINKIVKTLLDEVYFERKGSVICAVSALEMACWDIKGKALNVTVCDLLGGKINLKIDGYISDVYIDNNVDMVKYVSTKLPEGFSNIKIHVGNTKPDQTAHTIKCIRDAVGNETQLMVDLNAGYNYMDALQLVRYITPLNIKWLEEPLHPDHVDALAMLRQQSDIPIASGENEFGLHGFKELLDKKAVDVIMPDVGRVGGIMEAKNICTLAESYGIPVSFHNFSSGILFAATVNLFMATKNAYFLELDSSDNAIHDELLDQGAPGLGVKLPEEIIQQYST